MTLFERVQKCIWMKQEGSSWDFKREWHHDKGSLLHDIICMANLVTDEDGIIIIGVDEEKDYSIKDVSADQNRKNTQQLVTFLRDKKFVGGIRPQVKVETLDLDDGKVDVIVVFNSTNIPYYLSEPFEKVRANHIYTRIGDTNTPADKSADIDKVESLWKKRFGIDKPAFERYGIALSSPDDWESVDGEQSWFNHFFPEFTIITERDEDRHGYEYYCFSQMDSRPSWYFMKLYCNGTLIDDTLGIGLDGGRFFTVVPDVNSFQGDIIYSYVANSFHGKLNAFFMRKYADREAYSVSQWGDCIPIFETEEEKKNFFESIKGIDLSSVKIADYMKPYIPEKLPNNENSGIYASQYLRALKIVELLKRYRSEMR